MTYGTFKSVEEVATKFDIEVAEILFCQYRT